MLRVLDVARVACLPLGGDSCINIGIDQNIKCTGGGEEKGRGGEGGGKGLVKNRIGELVNVIG